MHRSSQNRSFQKVHLLRKTVANEARSLRTTSHSASAMEQIPSAYLHLHAGGYRRDEWHSLNKTSFYNGACVVTDTLQLAFPSDVGHVSNGLLGARLVTSIV